MSLSKTVKGNSFSLGLRLSLEFKEFTSVLIAVTDADLPAKDSNIIAYSEICGKKYQSRAVLSKHLTSFQEFTLGDATILLSRLTDHQSVVLKEVHDDNLADSIVFNSALSYAFFEISEESQNLL